MLGFVLYGSRPSKAATRFNNTDGSSTAQAQVTYTSISGTYGVAFSLQAQLQHRQTTAVMRQARID